MELKIGKKIIIIYLKYWEHIMLVTTRDPNPNHPFPPTAIALAHYE